MMLGDTLTMAGDVIEMLGMSVVTLLIGVAASLGIAAVVLVGKATRLAIWIEDLRYRPTQPAGSARLMAAAKADAGGYSTCTEWLIWASYAI